MTTTLESFEPELEPEQDSVCLLTIVEPDPEGPTTLRQHIDIADDSYAIQERIKYGDVFMPSYDPVRSRKEIQNLRARMATAVEQHPELVAMNIAHEKLLHALRRAEKGSQENVTRLQEICAALAREIVSLEKTATSQTRLLTPNTPSADGYWD